MIPDVDWNEARFDTRSWLPGVAAPIFELYVSPGHPRNLRVRVAFLH